MNRPLTQDEIDTLKDWHPEAFDTVPEKSSKPVEPCDKHQASIRELDEYDNGATR